MFSVDFWMWTFIIIGFIVFVMGVAGMRKGAIPKPVIFVIHLIALIILTYGLTLGLCFLRAVKMQTVICWLFLYLMFNALAYLIAFKLNPPVKGSEYLHIVSLVFAIILTLGGC